MRFSLAVILLLVVARVHAQSVEAEWRVMSDVSATRVPAYQNQPNPFPMREEIRAVVEESTDELTAEAQRRAQTIARARALLSSNQVFRPDTSQLVFGGYLKTVNGARVLHMEKWMKEGDTIDVPVRGADKAYETIREVKEVDPDMAEKLEKELVSRLNVASNISLKLVVVTPNEVVLRGGGETVRVDVSHGGL
ncbi:MAG: hypothetical protein H6922_05675 [Pseudomonadaceae bacterium]|nr:hypothetical protein [Pseudomonadaceae bacterium]